VTPTVLGLSPDAQDRSTQRQAGRRRLPNAGRRLRALQRRCQGAGTSKQGRLHRKG